MHLYPSISEGGAHGNLRPAWIRIRYGNDVVWNFPRVAGLSCFLASNISYGAKSLSLSLSFSLSIFFFFPGETSETSRAARCHTVTAASFVTWQRATWQRY